MWAHLRLKVENLGDITIQKSYYTRKKWCFHLNDFFSV